MKRLNLVKNKIEEIINKKQLQSDPKIIVVTKTFPITEITPLIENGHDHFGENKLQEAEFKWSELKAKNNNIKLHMLGKLQSNKARKAVQLFDYIHSLDNEKLALKLSTYEKELSKKNKIFIQINLANEKQKSGILINQLNEFYNYCTKDLSLNIIGLMCLPPVDSKPQKYFKLLKSTARNLKLYELSMGMSSDYDIAIEEGSTFLRIGTLIMGKRDLNN